MRRCLATSISLHRRKFSGLSSDGIILFKSQAIQNSPVCVAGIIQLQVACIALVQKRQVCLLFLILVNSFPLAGASVIIKRLLASKPTGELQFKQTVFSK